MLELKLQTLRPANASRQWSIPPARPSAGQPTVQECWHHSDDAFQTRVGVPAGVQRFRNTGSLRFVHQPDGPLLQWGVPPSVPIRTNLRTQQPSSEVVTKKLSRVRMLFA